MGPYEGVWIADRRMLADVAEPDVAPFAREEPFEVRRERSRMV